MTATIGIKLIVTLSRYILYKRTRQESIAAYLIDLLIVNGMITGVFIKANFMYFSQDNRCGLVEDGLIQMSYQIFCVLLAIGYLQFVWCILLSCYVPLTAFVIMKLVQHRVR